MSPRISVVIPVRNGMPHLAATLESVRSQSRSADEIVVVENGSTDTTLNFINSQNDVNLKVQPRPVSAAENWTSAVELASGDFVKVLCADYYLLPGCLERQSQILIANSNCVMTAARRRVIGPNSEVLAAAIGLGGLRGEVAGRVALRRALTLGTNLFGEVSSVMFKRDTLQRQLPWSNAAGYATDLEMYIRVLQNGSVLLDEEVLAQFRVTRQSWSYQTKSSQARDVVKTFHNAVSRGEITAGSSRKIVGAMSAYGRQVLRKWFYLRIPS